MKESNGARQYWCKGMSDGDQRQAVGAGGSGNEEVFWFWFWFWCFVRGLTRGKHLAGDRQDNMAGVLQELTRGFYYLAGDMDSTMVHDTWHLRLQLNADEWRVERVHPIQYNIS